MYGGRVLVLMIFMFCAKVIVEWDIPTDDISYITTSVHTCTRRNCSVHSNFLYAEVNIFIGLCSSFVAKQIKGLEDAFVWCLILMHSCSYVSGDFLYSLFGLKHEGQDGLDTGVAAPSPGCSQSTYVQNQRGGCGAVLYGQRCNTLWWGSEFSRLLGHLDGVGCNTMSYFKVHQFGGSAKVWQHDNKTNPPLLFGGCWYSTAWASVQSLHQ